MVKIRVRVRVRPPMMTMAKIYYQSLEVDVQFLSIASPTHVFQIVMSCRKLPRSQFLQRTLATLASWILSALGALQPNV